MSCPHPQLLQQLLDETLPKEETPAIQAHLETCPACQKKLEQLAAGGVTWDKTAHNLGEQPKSDETAMFNAVEKLQSEPTSALQTQTEAPRPPVDEELSFLQPSQKPNSLGRLDEYEILSVVGKGGFGIVLKAFDESLHRVVAIKVMLPHMAASGTARQRFHQEAKAAAAISHENVVTIHAVSKKDAKIPYLVMQFISGVTLNDKIDKAGPLSVTEILRIGMQIAAGLDAAHKQGKIHRDIKPANILLENGVERVKITDFGLARAADDASITQSGTVAGTPMYMSPEQANAEHVDQRTDLFSLGSVLYVMCTGRPPFRATSTMAVLKRVCDDTPTPVQEVNQDIPDWLGAIITKLHAKKPGERYQTAKEVAELLGNHLAHLQQPNHVAPPAPPTTPTPVPTEPRKSYTPLPARVWWGAGIGAFGFELFLFGTALREDTWSLRAALLLGHALLALMTLAACGLVFALNRAGRTRGALRLAQACILCGTLSAVCALTLVGISLAGFRPLYPVTFEMDDPAILVEIWPTAQTEPPVNLAGEFKIMGPPKYVIQHRTTDELRLPSGNYWLTAKLAGQEVHRVFMEIQADPLVWYHRSFVTYRREEKGKVVSWVSETTFGIPKVVSIPGLANLVQMENKKLQGAWRAVRADFDGKPLPEDQVSKINLRLKFEGDKATVQMLATAFTPHSIGQGAFTIDPGKKPATLDIAEAGAGKKLRAIYRLDGDELFLHFNFSDRERPKDFTAGSEFPLFVLKREKADSSPEKKAEPGWVQLFNGKDTTGWKVMGHDGWKARDGVLIGESYGPMGWLMSDKEYADFELSLDYKIAPGSNTGVFLRAWPEGAMTGGQFMEIQLIDNVKAANPKDKTGAIFSVVAPSPAPSAPVNQWHRVDIRVQGRQVQVTFDEQKILAANLDDHKDRFARFPGLTKTTGRIGLQLYPGHMEFKNIRVKELPPNPPGALVEAKRPDLAAPDFSSTKPFFEDRFQNPASGWGADKGDDYQVGYYDGRYFIALTPGGKRAQYCSATPPGDFACEVVGRATGTAEARWGLEIQNRANGRYLNFHVNGKQELEIFAVGEKAAMFKSIGPIRDTAIKPGDQFNKLLVVMRGGWTRVYVNGVAVCEPFAIDFVKAPATFAMVGRADKNTPSRAEFERFTIWPADALPAEPGWVQLFNGKDLTGWKSDKTKWAVKDGVLIATGKGSIETTQSYAKPLLMRAEMKLKRGKGTVRFNGDAAGNRFTMGVEEEDGKLAFLLKSTLPLLDEIKPVRGRFPVGADEWISIELRVDRETITLAIPSLPGMGGHHFNTKATTATRGPIELNTTSDDAEIRFRKIEIKELPPSYKDDKERLQGGWTAVDFEEGGRNQKEGLNVVQWLFTFTGDRCHVKSVTRDGRTSLDQDGLFLTDRTNPKRFRLVMPSDEKQVRELIGIYEFQGEYLRICYGGHPGVLVNVDYPTAFATKAGSPLQLMTLKRLPAVEPGWVQLFNGKDLTGWKASGPFEWSAQRGAIIGKDGVLNLERELQDFHCRFEAKVPAKSWLSLRFRSDYFGREALVYLKQGAKETCAGSLYFREKRTIPKLLVAPDKDLISPDVWFKVDVIVRGKLAEVKINGTTTAKTEIENMPARGKLAFSADSRGHLFHLRKIEIKELPPESAPPAAEPAWVQLFKDKDLDNWQGDTSLLRWNQDTLFLAPIDAKKAVLSKVVHRKAFKNFELEFDIKMGKETGLFPMPVSIQVRGKKQGAGAAERLVGYQVDVRPGTCGDLHHQGAAKLDRVKVSPRPANPKVFRKKDDFNHVRIRCQGKHLTVQLNGVTVLDEELADMPAAGFLSFHWSAWTEVLLKNIRMRELSDSPPPSAEKGVLDYAEIHDADEQRFDEWIAKMKKGGYRPVTVSVRMDKGSPRITAVAVLEQTKRVWELKHNDPADDEAFKRTKQMWNNGFIAYNLCGYWQNGQHKEYVLWTPRARAIAQSAYRSTTAVAEEKIAAAQKLGSRLWSRTVTVENGVLWHTIIVDAADATPWKAQSALTIDGIKEWIQNQRAGGWRADQLHAYGEGADTKFGGILIKDADHPDWDINWSLTPSQYEAEMKLRKKDGFRPHAAVGHDGRCTERGALRGAFGSASRCASNTGRDPSGRGSAFMLSPLVTFPSYGRGSFCVENETFAVGQGNICVATNRLSTNRGSPMRRLFFVCLLALAGADRAAAQTALELFPQDAVVGIAIRDLDDLIKKGDDFLKLSEIRVPIRPSQLFDQGTQFLGVNQGLNRKAPAAIILLSPEKDEDFNNFRFLNYLVPVLPFTDADMMAANFGLAKGKLAPKSVVRTDRQPNRSLTGYIARRRNHIYLNDSEKTLQRILKSKPAAASFTAEQRKQFDDSDVLLHFGNYLFKRKEVFAMGDAMQHVLAGSDPTEKEFAQQFVASLQEVENAVIGFRLHEGIDGHLLLTVPEDGQAAKLFKSLKAKHPPSTLKGLPEGNVLLAQASSGDAAHQAMLTKVLFSFLIEELLINQRIIHHVDRLTYLGVLQEVLRHLQGNRLAVYQNTEEKRLGLFSAVAILDTENAKGFVQAMKILSHMAVADSLDLSKKEVKDEIDVARLVRDLGSSVYAIRQSANTKLTLIGEPALPYLAKAIDLPKNDLETKRRAQELRDRINAVAAERRKELLDDKNRPLFASPKLTFVAHAEKRRDVSIDVIHIELAGLTKAARRQYAQLLGPDWDKVRLAIVGNQIVVLLGSDVALFEAALRNIQKGDAGLASTKRLAGFHASAAKDRMFEFHVSVEGVLRLINPKATLDTQAQMTSMALTLGEHSLQLDARVPMPEARVMARKAQEGMR